MTSLISIKSDCILAMENCIKNCRELEEVHQGKEEMSACLKLCKLCIDACQDCISACQSAQSNNGNFLNLCVDMCNACLVNFENYIQEEFKKSALACQVCIQKIEHYTD